MNNKQLTKAIGLAMVSVCVLLVPAVAQAQSFVDGVRFGGKAALNLTRVRGILVVDSDVAESGSAAGFSIGALAMFDTHPNVTIQPEFMYSLKNVDLLELDGEPVDGEVNLSFIEIPVLVKLHGQRDRPAVPFVLVGGTLSFLSDAERLRQLGSVTLTDDVEDELNSVGIGFTFGGGIDLRHDWGIVTLDARYTLALGDLTEQGNVKLDTFYAGAGVVF